MFGDKAREASFPKSPARARVDVVARVVSSDDAISPLSGVSAALVEIVAFETHVQFGPRWLGSRRYGERLEVADEAGTRLAIVMSEAVRVSPCGLFPTPVPDDHDDLPEELAELVHAITDSTLRHHHFHETVFRCGDRLRIVGTVGPSAEVTRDGPYRSSAAPGLVALADVEPLMVIELPSEGD